MLVVAAAVRLEGIVMKLKLSAALAAAARNLSRCKFVPLASFLMSALASDSVAM
jgi:hypothetical protein